MLRRPLRTMLGALALLAAASPARAQFPGLTATFIEPTGSGTTTDAFEVWVRLSLASGAAALQFDGTSPETNFGLPAGILPTHAFNGSANVPFASYTGASTSASYVCTGTFVQSNCAPVPYAFSFNTSGADPARPTLLFRDTFTLLPGATFDFLLGTFSPAGGAALPGTYTLYAARPLISVRGLGAAGEELSALATLASTCDTGDASCAFTRTVSAVSTVPEPGTLALTASGLALVGWLTRRRRAA